MSGIMRIFFLNFAVLVLLAQIFPARGSFTRQVHCSKLNGRCEAECLTFEDKIGGCRADLTPFCCKKRIKN
ncbi:beta-defensin 107A-like [Dasypus novemcinctus]|uniref:beta-defensin 107A-like n=1 Tax=Dasypus novemcinctus TaxID=9361 RepID=UPI0026600858|nr:beta-defensin 107A-like [Dasypus novemcinctus]